MANRTLALKRSTLVTGVTANTTFTISAGQALTGIYIRNRTANDVIGGIRIGTSSGASDVVDQITVVGNTILDPITIATFLKKTLFTMVNDTTLYIEARTSWNGASLDMQWFYAKVGDDFLDQWLSGLKRRTNRPDVHKILWDVLDKINIFALSSSGVEAFGQVVMSPNGQLRLGSKTVGQLNAMTGLTAGDEAFCTNESGGAQPVFYDGSNWRRGTDRAIIS